MPSDDKESYKEMYEMGQRLMDMAKNGGYDPDSEEYGDEESDEMGMESASTAMPSSSTKDKVSAALSMMK